MLVLTRYKDESIVITTVEGCTEVTIMEVHGGKIRLGIVAPKNVSVHRKEVQLLINKEKGIENGTITNMSC